MGDVSEARETRHGVRETNRDSGIRSTRVEREWRCVGVFERDWG